NPRTLEEAAGYRGGAAGTTMPTGANRMCPSTSDMRRMHLNVTLGGTTRITLMNGNSLAHEPGKGIGNCVHRPTGGHSAIHVGRVELGSRRGSMESRGTSDHQGGNGGSVRAGGLRTRAAVLMNHALAEHRMRGVHTPIDEAESGARTCANSCPGTAALRRCAGGSGRRAGCAVHVQVIEVVSPCRIQRSETLQRAPRRGAAGRS